MSLVMRKQEVRFLQKRQRDGVGRVFTWNGGIFRGIFPEHESYVRSLFSTGFLDELISQNYFPRTWIADYRMEDFSLILEHEKIWPVVYPQEWTFSMLKDAALLVYKIGLMAKEYGFNMKDCHGLNVLFDGTSPKFSDLGSFIPDQYVGWKPYGEFLRFYYYPLSIWEHNSFVGKLSIFSGNLTPHEVYLLYKYPFLRSIGPKLLRKFVNLHIMPEIIANRQSPGVSRGSWSRAVLNPVIMLKQLIRKAVSVKSLNLDRVIKEIEGMQHNRTKSTWGSYHDEIIEKAKRFDRIIEIINMLGDDVRCAADLGGNQGRFSRLLIQETNLEKVVCIDYDENAINAGYNRERTVNTGRITFAHYDFMGCIVKLRFMLPSERFKSDIAIALALTHHLVLSQGYDINDILGHISAYARKYVFIEFMPLGLWTTEQKPNVPDWYTHDWFRQSFVKFFDLVVEERLRENNILFVGKVRPDS